MILRDYQLRAVEQLRTLLRRGRRRLLLVAPCGAGKGTCLAALTGQWDAAGAGVLVLAHRRELIDDLHARIVAEGVRAGVVMAGHPLADAGARVQVGSVQTVVNRSLPVPPHYVVFDEAHRSVAPSYLRIAERYPGAVLLGATASPWRADGLGLGSLYEEVVVAATTRELMDRGWLVEYCGWGFGEPDLSGVRVVAGDYDQRQLGRVMGGSAILGDIVQRWLDSAGGVRTVAFAVNREHSRRIAADFAAAGVTAEHLDGETPAEERRAILERWRAGATRIVSNVEILTEGYDLPALGCVILARPTLSTRLAVQMVGRGLRPAAGKERLRIHDHAGVLWRHGLPDAERDYSLTADTRKRRKDPPAALATCGACGALLGPGAASCPGCGASRQVRRREIETLEGAKAVSLDDLRGVSEDAPDEQRDVFLALWGKAAGKPPGWASEQFRKKTGKFPRWRWLREARRTG